MDIVFRLRGAAAGPYPFFQPEAMFSALCDQAANTIEELRTPAPLTEEMIDAAAEALWLGASKERFGPWSGVDEKVKVLWRKDAKAALESALQRGK